jgi:hypothetical protein
MNQHPYLRAYMAGIVVPTAFLLVVLTVFCLARFVFGFPVPIERLIVFPMAVIPNIFGVWNMLYLIQRPHWHTPIGLHGALLLFVLAPLGFVAASTLGYVRVAEHGLIYFEVLHVPYWWLAVGPFVGIALYYLVWKYVVGFLNRLVGIGD